MPRRKIAYIIAVALFLAFTIYQASRFFDVFDFSKKEMSQENEQISVEKFPDGLKIGAWMWESAFDYEEGEAHELLSNVRAEGFNEIYLNVEKYISISEMDSPEKIQREKQKFIERSARFNRIAHENGIAVHALGGSNEWSRPSYHYIPNRILDFVADFNATHANEEKFRGVQFDIEPYAQAEFNDETADKILSDYLNLAESLSVTIEARNPDK
jgi:hypothetical protein